MTKIKFEVILDTADEREMEALKVLTATLRGQVKQAEANILKDPSVKDEAREEAAKTSSATEERAETEAERKERKRLEANRRKREKRAAERAAQAEADKKAEEAETAQEEQEEQKPESAPVGEKTAAEWYNEARKLVSANVKEHRDEIKEELARMGARNVSSVPADSIEAFCNFLELL